MPFWKKRLAAVLDSPTGFSDALARLVSVKAEKAEPAVE
jgi:hypothetical protein